MLYRLTTLTYSYHTIGLLALGKSIYVNLASSSVIHLRVHFGELLNGVKIRFDFWDSLD